MFVVLGAQADGTRHLVLSSSLIPRLTVPATSAMAVPRYSSDNHEDEHMTLAVLSAHLVAMEILRPLRGPEAVLVAHKLLPLILAALRIQCEIQSI